MPKTHGLSAAHRVKQTETIEKSCLDHAGPAGHVPAFSQALIPACPEPVNAGTPPDRRRPSDELATATTAPLAPLAPRGHRNGRASPDFGARGEPPAPKSVPPWGAGALGQSTRVKGDLFGRYEMQAGENWL